MASCGHPAAQTRIAPAVSSGGWLVPYFDAKFGEIMTEWTKRSGAFLLGRKTHEIFAKSWPKSTEAADENATALNTPAEVRRIQDARKDQLEQLQGDVAQEVAKLKAQEGGELQVHDSGNLI
jgi:dihydrofolate reductase